jgi:2-oxoglutarate dehydrogenase E1 component
MAVSEPEDFTERGFQPLIPDSTARADAKRLVFCSGKVYYDMVQALAEADRQDVAVLRVEQLYPFPKLEILDELAKYDADAEFIWLQNEPRNMGAWTFVSDRFDAMLEELRGDGAKRIRFAGRPPMASPATGSAHVHQREQEALLGMAMGEKTGE